MRNYSISEIQKQYDLQLEKVTENIKKEKAKLVLLQFADGLKQYATTIVDYLREQTNAEFLIWLDTCYGACDTPVLTKELENKIDLMFQFGHNDVMPSY